MKQKDWEPERNEWCKVRWWVQAALGKVYSEGEGFRETDFLKTWEALFSQAGKRLIEGRF